GLVDGERDAPVHPGRDRGVLAVQAGVDGRETLPGLDLVALDQPGQLAEGEFVGHQPSPFEDGPGSCFTGRSGVSTGICGSGLEPFSRASTSARPDWDMPVTLAAWASAASR